MNGGLEKLNAVPAAEARARFLSCCGSTEWARRMAAARPFGSFDSLAATADRTWWDLKKDDWLEAFAAHPPIGTKINLSPFSQQEQSGTSGATAETLEELADVNRRYAERFGHVFLVFATGKTAAEMLAIGRKRLGNDPETELPIAAEEQRKITRLRLEQLLLENER